MSITRTALMALVAVSALTVLTPGHAETPAQVGQQLVALNQVQYDEPSVTRQLYNTTSDRLQTVVNTITTPVVDAKELVCLARNIFFEAGNEPEEGKVAVGLVTLNRLQDGRFGKSVCGVVDQKLTRDIPHKQIIEKKHMFKVEREEHTVWSKLTICQFSWRCMFVKNPKSQDERWLASQAIANELLSSEISYAEYRDKYDGALYFHATGIRPSWAHQKERITRIGGHAFYKEPPTKVATSN
jgi:spore germination cell wall hydrolase CwlJ-like protein